MDRLGFIHDKLDIKLLILFILRRLTGVADQDVLWELCQCDGGVGYFEYSDCLHELVDNGHIDEVDGGFKITEKGARNCDTVESSLPYSVRAKAEKLIAPVEEKMRRDAMIVSRHAMTENGLITTLSMSDGKGDVIKMELLVADETQAGILEANFRRRAEKYYHEIIALLSDEKKK